MCGIAGYYLRNGQEDFPLLLEAAVKTLDKRGPNFQKTEVLSATTGFGHSRLCIIDPSARANQPMSDSTGRYTIIFNGEIFNFRELQKQFLQDTELKTTSDTEILLYLFARMGAKCLSLLNGFFAFAIYDKFTGEIFMARDRFGIKPLQIYSDNRMIIFASELKAILKFPVKKEIDFNTLALYLQLNYVPGTNSILKNVQKLSPGHYAVISNDGVLRTEQYYSIPYVAGKKITAGNISYHEAKREVKRLIEEAVERRLVSDVPLGAFLSGGIDSSIITACAAKRVRGLNTFSIGYRDEPYFDETAYATLLAKKYNTQHTVFSVSGRDMLEKIYPVLDYTDEPFADSSAIAVYLLSEKTRQSATVALSGDGGDELFGGYEKHEAELTARKKNLLNTLMRTGNSLFAMLPKSRHSRLTNFFRQLNRYSDGLLLTPQQRYWRWCILTPQPGVFELFKNTGLISADEIEKRKAEITSYIKEDGDLNDVLMADTHMVLPNDMLVKVDMMSMANSLEVRVPLLDYTVVNYAFSLPVSWKIGSGVKKRILKEAFAAELPPELLKRPKQGFEVPLLKWMRTELRELIENDLLGRSFVLEQGIFDYEKIAVLKKKIFSSSPGDIHAAIWGLVVFQYWYKKYYL